VAAEQVRSVCGKERALDEVAAQTIRAKGFPAGGRKALLEVWFGLGICGKFSRVVILSDVPAS
jgi:hypothetical protein